MYAEKGPLPLLDIFAHLCSLTPLHTYAVYQIKSSLVLMHSPAGQGTSKCKKKILWEKIRKCAPIPTPRTDYYAGGLHDQEYVLEEQSLVSKHFVMKYIQFLLHS